MKPTTVALLLTFVPMPLFAADSKPLKYPATQKGTVSDDYHGRKIADPFRWLEDDNSEETKAWVKSQNEVTFSYLKTLPKREEIKSRLTKLWNYARVGRPFERGGRWFFTQNSGLQNQSVLYSTTSLEAKPDVLIDPNTMSSDGTVSLTDYTPSEDGKLLAYATSSAGSDWSEVRIRDIAKGADLMDHIRWIKFSGVSWMKDGSGFFYSRYDAPKAGAALTEKNEFHKLYFHKLGTPQSEDALIYERKDQPEWSFGGGVTEDGKYLIIQVWKGTEPKNRVFFKELSQPESPVVELLNEADAKYEFVDNDGPVFLFRTNLDAPRYRVIGIDTTKPKKENWVEIVPQAKAMLDNATTAGGQLFCEYLQDAKSAVRSFDFKGKFIRDITLPGIGTAGGFGGHREDRETFYVFTSFTEPGAIFRLDLATGQSTVWRRPEVGFDGSAFETKQVFFPSKDGTQIPMFIVHKRGIELDGTHPTLLYGYGGFNISLTPSFSIPRAVWLEMGGIYAMPNLRGGGEYGADWHSAGIKLKKQNVFDDFIAAAEWLISKKFTSSKKLAIMGGSNGGLLVGACMTQRPDLFAAALPAVGVMDMLRFHKFTIGWGWKSDYGSSENPEEFKALLAYSPLHNLKPGTRYPATLVTTADHDDRVVPAHSFKFAARLQECQVSDGPPTLIRIETSAGHGAGTALNKVIDETADEWAFLVKELGLN